VGAFGQIDSDLWVPETSFPVELPAQPRRIRLGEDYSWDYYDDLEAEDRQFEKIATPELMKALEAGDFDIVIAGLKYPVRLENPAANYIMGVIYYPPSEMLNHKNAPKFPIDAKKAMKYYRIAEKNGHKSAALNIGEIYSDPNSGLTDYDKAKQVYEKLLPTDFGDEAFLGLKKLFAKSYLKESSRYFSESDLMRVYGESVHSPRSVSIGYMVGLLMDGDNVRQDNALALEFMRRGVAANNPESLYQQGRLHLYGLSLKKSKNKALFYFEKAALEGHINAGLEAALLLLSGERGGLSKSEAKEQAFEYALNAAHSGNLRSQLLVSELYAERSDKAKSDLWTDYAKKTAGRRIAYKNAGSEILMPFDKIEEIIEAHIESGDEKSLKAALALEMAVSRDVSRVEFIELHKQIMSALEPYRSKETEASADPFLSQLLNEIVGYGFETKSYALKNQNFAKALSMAEAGNVEAAGVVGEIYAKLPRKVKEDDKAIRWLKVAIDSGDVEAMKDMANLYWRQHNYNRQSLDDTPLMKAVEYYRMAADAGDKFSHYRVYDNVAKMKSPSIEMKAFGNAYLQKAVDLGDASALETMAKKTLEMDPPDFQAAIAFYEQAALEVWDAKYFVKLAEVYEQTNNPNMALFHYYNAKGAIDKRSMSVGLYRRDRDLKKNIAEGIARLIQE